MKDFLGGDLKWFFFSFRGRIKRAPFIFGMIGWPCFVVLLVWLPFLIFQIPKSYTFTNLLFGIAFLCFVLAAFVLASLPFFALSAKRLHDCGRSGYLYFWLPLFIPVLSLPLFLYLCSAPSAAAASLSEKSDFSLRRRRQRRLRSRCRS